MRALSPNVRLQKQVHRLCRSVEQRYFAVFVETSCLVTFWLLGTNGLACTLGTNCVLVAQFSVACERP